MSRKLISSNSEESQAGAATATLLLGALMLSELGIMTFFQQNDNNCKHNTVQNNAAIMEHN